MKTPGWITRLERSRDKWPWHTPVPAEPRKKGTRSGIDRGRGVLQMITRWRRPRPTEYSIGNMLDSDCAVGSVLRGGRLQLRRIRPDHRQIRWRVRMHAEIPHIAVHPLLAEQLRHRVLSRLQRSLRRQLDPALAHLLRCGRDRFLLLT